MRRCRKCLKWFADGFVEQQKLCIACETENQKGANNLVEQLSLETALAQQTLDLETNPGRDS